MMGRACRRPLPSTMMLILSAWALCKRLRASLGVHWKSFRPPERCLAWNSAQTRSAAERRRLFPIRRNRRSVPVSPTWQLEILSRVSAWLRASSPGAAPHRRPCGALPCLPRDALKLFCRRRLQERRCKHLARGSQPRAFLQLHAWLVAVGELDASLRARRGWRRQCGPGPLADLPPKSSTISRKSRPMLNSTRALSPHSCVLCLCSGVAGAADGSTSLVAPCPMTPFISPQVASCLLRICHCADRPRFRNLASDLP